MKLADRSLIKRVFTLALALVLAMGLAPLPAMATTSMVVKSASDRTEAAFANKTTMQAATSRPHPKEASPSRPMPPKAQ